MDAITKYGGARFFGAASTFRTLGDAGAASQNLLTIETSASGPSVRVLSCVVTHDSTAVLVNPSLHAILAYTTALPTGGTALAKTGHPTVTSNAAVVVRGSPATDGGALVAITATAAAARFASRFLDRLHTAAGQSIPSERELVPPIFRDRGISLTRGTALVVQVIDVDAATIPVTDHFIATVVWSEL